MSVKEKDTKQYGETREQTINYTVLAKPPKPLRKLIKERRERYHLKQNTLSEMTGISPSVLNKIETGRTTKPSMETLIAIAPYIGTEFGDLLFSAGYSKIDEDDVYYDDRGEIIPFYDIVADVYEADWALLKELQEINKLHYEDVKLITSLIRLFKLDVSSAAGVWKKLFRATVTFLSEQLSAIAEMAE